MRITLLLGIVFVAIGACDARPLEFGLPLAKQTCGEMPYRHKSEAEIARMNARQLVDEAVKEQIYHMPDVDNYGFDVVEKYIRRVPGEVVPVLTKYIAGYDPPNASKCEHTRFFVAHTTAGDLDNFVVRIRATMEGRALIEALDGAMDRMRRAGLESRSDYPLAAIHLKELKGVNERDIEIQETLQKSENLTISDGDLLAFSEYLIKVDPQYPSWSAVMGGPPPIVLENGEPFYKAYVKFINSKAPSR